MDSVNSNIVFLICAAAFVFVATTSVIVWFLSNKYPNAWFLNKVVVVVLLIFTTSIVVGIIIEQSTYKLPSSVFKKHFGFSPTSGIENLQVSFEQKGEHYSERLNFKADKETFNKMLSQCFYEITSTEIRDSADDGVKEFLKNPQTHYYEKPERDIEGTNCIGDFHSYSLIAYDEASGKAYFYWHYNDF